MACVALVYNLIKPDMLKDGPLDRSAEYDSVETLTAVTEALRAGGHQVIPLEADERIADKLLVAQPEVVFNIAEGLRGESRESHVPAICEMLGIPYMGSGPLTLALCLNKARTKEILSVYGIPTPRFQVLTSATDPVRLDLSYPLIVKLLHEGSSMGLTRESVVLDDLGLRRQAARLIETYGEEVIVEEYVIGREFTAPVLGNETLRVLPIVEAIFADPLGIVLFEFDDAVKPLVEQARGHTGELVGSASHSQHRSVCPADIDDTLRARIDDIARRAYRALGCRDWCRMEMRLGRDDQLYVLELNPIAGIDPSYWFARSARAAGLSYDAFINLLLDYALKRRRVESLLTA